MGWDYESDGVGNLTDQTDPNAGRDEGLARGGLTGTTVRL